MAYDTGGSAYGTATIGATAGAISDGSSRRKSILVQNVHASNVLYVGTDSSVLTSTGIRINPGEAVEIQASNKAIYGIASGAGTDVRYLELG